MGNEVRSERVVAEHTAYDVRVEVIRVTWQQGGYGYDVVVKGGELITDDGALDEYPEESQIRALVRRHVNDKVQENLRNMANRGK